MGEFRECIFRQPKKIYRLFIVRPTFIASGRLRYNDKLRQLQPTCKTSNLDGMKCSQFMSKTVLVAVMLPLFVQAQPWPDPVPEPTLPEITATPVPNPGVAGTFFSNAYKFSLLWPAVPSTTALNNPPHPINSAQTEVPRWRYFWKFGDQTYSTDSMPVHTFPATSTPLEFDVEVSLKPIYADDYDALKKKKKKKVGI